MTITMLAKIMMLMFVVKIRGLRSCDHEDVDVDDDDDNDDDDDDDDDDVKRIMRPITIALRVSQGQEVNFNQEDAKFNQETNLNEDPIENQDTNLSLEANPNLEANLNLEAIHNLEANQKQAPRIRQRIKPSQGTRYRKFYLYHEKFIIILIVSSLFL